MVDTPDKASPDKAPEGIDTTIAELGRMPSDAHQEIILISPYFVPGDRGVASMAKLVRQGVKLRVPTNSLAATDAPIVHVGYRRYRVAQLFAGAIDDNSYLLRLSDRGAVQWVDGKGDRAVVLDAEPDTTWSRRLGIDLLAPFTPEELL